LLHQHEYPSWAYSIRRGATTIWERWDGWTVDRGFQAPAMNSFNHYSLGSVGDWLYGRVAGIDQTPGSVAFSELRLRPLPGGRLRRARAEQETAAPSDAGVTLRLASGPYTFSAAAPAAHPPTTLVAGEPT
jgi:alpha-L-rhamnosidase